MFKTKWGLWSILLAGALVGGLQAEIQQIVLDPIVAGATGATYNGGQGFYTGGCPVGYWLPMPPGDTDLYYWCKYQIPAMPGRYIVQMFLDVDVWYQHDTTYTAGIRIYNVLDPDFTASTITHTREVGSYITNRDPSDNAASFGWGLISSNVSAFTDYSKEGQEHYIAFRLTRTGGGARGVYLRYHPKLVLFTEEVPAPKPWSQGHDILMRKGLQVVAAVNPDPVNVFHPETWAQSNFTTANIWYLSDPGVLGGTSHTIPYARVAGAFWMSKDEMINYYDQLVSLQYDDEQYIADPDVRDSLVGHIALWQKQHRNIICHANFSQVETGYSEDWAIIDYMDRAKPDMLMHTLYPWGDPYYGGGQPALYQRLQKFRLLGNQGPAGEKPIPYGVYMQTINYNPAGSYFPSDSEMRLSQFAAWAMGYKYVAAFVYDNFYEDILPGYWDALGSLFYGPGDTNPRPQFAQLAETNRQSRNLGKALVRLYSTDVRLIPNQYSVPSNMQAWDKDTVPEPRYITSITAARVGGGSPGDVLIGYFKPLDASLNGNVDGNDVYFMIVNALVSPVINGDAANTGLVSQNRQEITVKFNFGTSGINSLQRLSRQTGQVEIVPLTPVTNEPGVTHKLVFTLDGGTGDLFKFNNGVPFINGPVVCGNPGTVYYEADVSGPQGVPDCKVDLYDFAAFAEQWLFYKTKTTVINPVLNIAYRSDGAVDSYCYYAFYPLQYKYWRTASKFQIPTLAPYEQVVSLVLEFNIAELVGSPIWVHNGYETDDSWGTYTAYTLGTLDSPYVSSYITGAGVYTADVTSFLSQPGEGPGQLLTILGDFGSGYNQGGASGTYRRLILTTRVPAFDEDLDISGPLGSPDNQIDVYDIHALAEQWLCNDLEGNCM